MTNNIGFHMLVDDMPNHEIDEMISLYKDTSPAISNVMGGSKQALAMQTIERILLVQGKKTTNILRFWPDDGLLKVFQYNSEAYWATRIQPIEKWLRDTGTVFLIDNESIEDDMSPYVGCTVRLMEKGYEKGVRLAVGRFATGNPRETQYAQFDPMLLMMAVQPGFHILSPNEYTDGTSGTGHTGRFLHFFERCDSLDIPYPRTSIGEFGYLLNHDPEKGYRFVKMDGAKYADSLFNLSKVYYTPWAVTSSIYCVGRLSQKWKYLQVGDDTGFIARYRALASEIKDTPDPTPVVPSGKTLAAIAWIDTAAKYVHIRVGPDTIYPIIGKLNHGESCVVYPDLGITNYAFVRIGKVSGYVSLLNGKVVLRDKIPLPEPEPKPIPEYPTMSVSIFVGSELVISNPITRDDYAEGEVHYVINIGKAETK